MQISKFAIIAVATLASAGVQAQDTVHWALPSTSTVRQSYFPVGTPLKLTNRVELSTKQQRAGERFYLEVAEPLTYRDQVVVPVGSIAVGEIVRSEGNGAFGKRGTLGIRLLYVQTPQGPIRLVGQEVRSGAGRATLAIGGGALIAWPMFFIRGKSGVLPANSVVTAQLLDDLPFPVSSGPATIATVMTVPLASR